jgi:Lar family restriction alleviation protein
MTDNSGRVGDAETGSREPSPKGLGPTGFDPARDLLPCPFCGTDPVLLETNELRPDKYQRYVTVRCDQCGVEVSEEYEFEVIPNWNHRGQEQST